MKLRKTWNHCKTWHFQKFDTLENMKSLEILYTLENLDTLESLDITRKHTNWNTFFSHLISRSPPREHWLLQNILIEYSLVMSNISLSVEGNENENIEVEELIYKINEKTASNVVKNNVIFSSIFIAVISVIVIRYLQWQWRT